jgi:feruloyl esterase
MRQQSSWQKGLAGGLDGPATEIRGTGQLEEVEHVSPNPGNLRMFQYVPQALQENPPLVVILHGCTQTAAAYADGAGWIELADRYGFVLLMPEQRRANNPNLCFNWFLPGDTTRDAGEVHSIRHMITRAIADHHIDQNRVFVTGLSAGGAMTSAMLATYPEVFAAGGIIAGLPYQSASDIPGAFQAMGEARILPPTGWASLVRSASHHKGPWPKVSIWHGADDKTVHPGNAAEIAKQWTEIHGAGQKPDAVEPHATYTRRVWNNDAGEPVIEEYSVPGLGHGTPLATGDGKDHFGAPAPYLLEAGVSSSHRLAEFWGIAAPGSVKATAPSTQRAAPISESRPDARIKSPAAARAMVAKPERRSSDTRRPSPGPTRYDIGSVINRALKSAGLIK